MQLIPSILMLALLLSLSVTSPPSPSALVAQADAPCQNTDAVLPADDRRELTLEQFGVSVMIPENYRAILRNDGSVQVVDPGTFNLIRCEAIGGDPLGRGFSDLVIRQVIPDADQPLEDIVTQAVRPDRPRQSAPCVSPYPLEGRQGYLVSTMTERHAEFWIDLESSEGITVFETSCDCSGMVDRLVDVLNRTQIQS